MAGLSDVLRRQKQTGETAFEAVVSLCREGHEVRILEFGTFSKVHKEEHAGRNPATGEALVVPAKDVLHFKPKKGIDMSVPKAAPTPRRR